MPDLTDYTCGFEGEVSENGPEVAARLFDLGLAAHGNLHDYHCGCSECTPDVESSYLFYPQRDCTVSAECISSILPYGSDRMERALEGWQRACLEANAQMSDSAGCHVHVGIDHLDVDQRWRLARLFAATQDDLGRLAAGKFGYVRSYNYRIESLPARRGADSYRYGLPYRGHWLALTERSHTAEFRLWNASVTAWRVRMYLGVSVAYVAAAADGRLVPNGRDQDHSLVRMVGNYLDPTTLGLVLAQLDYHTPH